MATSVLDIVDVVHPIRGVSLRANVKRLSKFYEHETENGYCFKGVFTDGKASLDFICFIKDDPRAAYQLCQGSLRRQITVVVNKCSIEKNCRRSGLIVILSKLSEVHRCMDPIPFSSEEEEEPTKLKDLFRFRDSTETSVFVSLKERRGEKEVLVKGEPRTIFIDLIQDDSGEIELHAWDTNILPSEGSILLKNVLVKIYGENTYLSTAAYTETIPEWACRALTYG